MMTTCWPISRPALENCKISERLFSFRDYQAARFPLSEQATRALPKSKLIYLIFDDIRRACQQVIDCEGNIVAPIFGGLSTAYFRLPAVD